MPSIVSIIVPCYNYGHFLAECLDSVLSQTNKDWECLVVDNGSTDHTAEVVKQYAAKDPRVKYVFTEQKGVSLARNLGVAQSKGEFILPLDADDKIAPRYLELALKVFRSKPEYKLVYCNAALFGERSGDWKLPAYSYRDLLVENMLFCSAVIRRADFDSVGGYSQDMQEGFEDWELWIRLLNGESKVYCIPELLFYYRIRPNSRNNSLELEKQRKLRKLIYEKHKAIYDKYFVLPELIFEMVLLKREFVKIKNSKAQHLAQALLAPLRFFQQLFKGA